MRLFTEAAEVATAVAEIRANATRFTTSLFATRDELDAWFLSGVLSFADYPGCLLVFRADRDFVHVYHAAASAGALEAALSRGEDHPGAVKVADLVGLPEDAESLARIYRNQGYSDYTSLIRMARTVGVPAASPSDPAGAEFAGVDDVPAVSSFLARTLDRFRDQIPDADALRAATKNRNIVVDRQGEDVGGVLFFQTTGVTSWLRYWYVDPRFQGRGIGGRLIRTWFRACGGCRRFILWVVADNTDTIARYRHYGFRDDKLVDRIMIWRRSR